MRTDMNKISTWASYNILQARLLIIFIEILKGCIAVNLGFMLIKGLSPTLTEIAVISFGSVLFATERYYHRRREEKKDLRKRFFNQRNRTLTLIYSCQIALYMLVGASIYNFEPMPTDVATQPAVQSTIEFNKSVPTASTPYSSVKTIKKTFRSRLYDRFMTKWQKHLAGNDSNSYKTLFIILGILLILFGFLMGLGLACGVACGAKASDLIFLILLVVGCVGGGIWLLIKAFKKVSPS